MHIGFMKFTKSLNYLSILKNLQQRTSDELTVVHQSTNQKHKK